MKSAVKIVLVDDHTLVRSSLANMVNEFDNCRVIFEACNGLDFIRQVKVNTVPDLVILDLNMEQMDGYETAKWLFSNMPEVRILMLSMYSTEMSLLRMLRIGVKGFLRKDVHVSELKTAIDAIMNAGYYYSYDVAGKIMNLFRKSDEPSALSNKSLITDSELQFLKLACTEDTYKEIAQKMKMNPRGIDNLRDHLFTKLDVKSRIGLAMYAVRPGLVTI
jgi:two-component system, NarL family, invasion response regulator UvrY